jgi:hypothetical protein
MPAGCEAGPDDSRNDSKRRSRKPHAARKVAKAFGTYPNILLEPHFEGMLEDAIDMQLDWYDDRGTSGQLRGGADAEDNTDASR